MYGFLATLVTFCLVVGLGVGATYFAIAIRPQGILERVLVGFAQALAALYVLAVVLYGWPPRFEYSPMFGPTIFFFCGQLLMLPTAVFAVRKRRNTPRTDKKVEFDWDEYFPIAGMVVFGHSAKR